MTTATGFAEPLLEQLKAPGPINIELQVARWVNTLRSLHCTTTSKEWQQLCQKEIRESEILPLLHKDPFTGHAFHKPRGYAGDADLIDYIYKHPSRLPSLIAAEPVGRSIYTYTSDSSSCRSVRQRREMLAAEIDRVAGTRDNARSLSFACGHLREGLLSNALAQGRLGSVWAVDQDAESLSEVSRTFSGCPVEARAGSVKQLIRRRLDLPQAFDFVYTAGLFDYLEHNIAALVTKRLFDHVAPGGKLWIANFAPELMDRGYMEAVMDWWLIYRDEPAMAKILEEVSPYQIASSRLFREPEGNLCFLEIVRR